MTGETSDQLSREFRLDLEAILSRQLTADNVNRYAADALVQLISLIGRASDAYTGTAEGTTATTSNLEGAALEDAALEHLGLPDVGAILDHIGVLDDDSKAIDDILDGVDNVDAILVPPSTEQRLNPRLADGSFTPARQRDLTKIILLALGQELGIDVRDPETTRVVRGSVSPDMMRKEPYYAVEIDNEGMQRLILVCDEEHNAIFVFDTTKLPTGVSVEQIKVMTKPEMNQLISLTPGLGQRLKYTEHFIRRFVRAFNSPATPQSTADAEAGAQYLRLDPDAPNSPAQLARRLGRSSTRLIDTAIQELGATLGVVRTVEYKGKTVADLSPEQQGLIRAWILEDRRLHPRAPKDYTTAAVFGTQLHVSAEKIQTAAATVLDPSQVAIYWRTRYEGALYYSPDQQRKIITQLEATGTNVNITKLPEDATTMQGLVEASGRSRAEVWRTINGLGDRLGPVVDYLLEVNEGKTARGKGYSPDQTKLILDELKAPQGMLIGEVAERLGVSRETALRAVRNTLSDLHRIPATAHTKSQHWLYSVQDESVLHGWLAAQGYYNEVPGDSISLLSYATAKKIGHHTLKMLIDEQVVAGNMEQPANHYFGSRGPTYAITPEAQTFLVGVIEAWKLRRHHG